MSKEPFDSIMAGLKDAIAYAKGDKTRYAKEDKTRGTIHYPEASPTRESPIKLSKEQPTKRQR